MISQWENEYISLSVLDPRGPGSIPSHGGVFQWIFLWLITHCQPVLSQRGRKWLNLPLNDTAQLVDIKGEGRSSTADRQWLKIIIKLMLTTASRS